MILERSRLKIPEATKDVTEGEIMFPGLKTCYMEANTQNDGKMEIFQRNALIGALSMVHTPREIPCTPSMPWAPRAYIFGTLRRPELGLCAPSIFCL